MHGALRNPNLISLFHLRQLPTICRVRPRVDANVLNTANFTTTARVDTDKRKDKDVKSSTIVTKNRNGKVIYRIRSSHKRMQLLSAKIRRDKVLQNTSQSADELLKKSRKSRTLLKTSGNIPSNEPSNEVQLKGPTVGNAKVKEENVGKDSTSNSTSKAKSKAIDPRLKNEKIQLVNQKSSSTIKQEKGKSDQRATERRSPRAKKDETVIQLTPRRVKFSFTEMVFSDTKTDQSLVAANSGLVTKPKTKHVPLQRPAKSKEHPIDVKGKRETTRKPNHVPKENLKKDKSMSDPSLRNTNKLCSKVEELNNICVQALKDEAEMTDSKGKRSSDTLLTFKINNSSTTKTVEMPHQKNVVDTRRSKIPVTSQNEKLQEKSKTRTVNLKKRRNRRSRTSKKLNEIPVRVDEAAETSNKEEIKRVKCFEKCDVTRNVEASTIGISLTESKRLSERCLNSSAENKLNSEPSTNNNRETDNQNKGHVVGSTTASNKVKHLNNAPISKENTQSRDFPVDVLRVGKQSKPAPVTFPTAQASSQLNQETNKSSVTNSSPANHTAFISEKSELNSNVAQLSKLTGLKKHPTQSMVARYENQRNLKDRSHTTTRKDTPNTRKNTKITFNPHVDTKPIIQSIAVIRSPLPKGESIEQFSQESSQDNSDAASVSPVSHKPNNVDSMGVGGQRKNGINQSSKIFAEHDLNAEEVKVGSNADAMNVDAQFDSSLTKETSATKSAAFNTSAPTRVDHERYKTPDHPKSTPIELSNTNELGSVRMTNFSLPKAGNSISNIDKISVSANTLDRSQVGQPNNSEDNNDFKGPSPQPKSAISSANSFVSSQTRTSPMEGSRNINNIISFSSPCVGIPSVPSCKAAFENEKFSRPLMSQTPTFSSACRPTFPPPCKGSTVRCGVVESTVKSCPTYPSCVPKCKPQFPPPCMSSCGGNTYHASNISQPYIGSPPRDPAQIACEPSCKPCFPPACPNARLQANSRIDSHRSMKSSLAFTSPCDGIASICTPSCKPSFPPQCASMVYQERVPPMSVSFSQASVPCSPSSNPLQYNSPTSQVNSYSASSEACEPHSTPFSFECCTPAQPQSQAQYSTPCQPIEPLSDELQCNSCYRTYTKSETHSIQDVDKMPRPYIPIQIGFKPKLKHKFADPCCLPPKESIKPTNKPVKPTQASFLRTLAQGAKLTSSYMTSLTGTARNFIDWFLKLLQIGVIGAYRRTICGSKRTQPITHQDSPNIIKSGVSIPRSVHKKPKPTDITSYTSRARMKTQARSQVKMYNSKARIVRSVKRPIHDDRCKRTVAQVQRRTRNSIGGRASPALAYSEVLNIVFSQRK